MLWVFPKIFPTLGAKQVHIWRASLKRTKEELLELDSFLNLEEQARAARFIVKDAANNFIVARGILRKLLAKYLHVLPQDLVFHQGQYGKLYLESLPIHFNLSHSHDLALFIFVANNPVGVDVEFIRKDYEFIDIAQKFFSPKESAELFFLPKNKQLQAFFNCWTCKEAFIKGKGVGLFYALDKFSVEISTNKWGKIKLADDDNSTELLKWSLEIVDPGDNYAAAFATTLIDSQLELYCV